MIKSFQAEHFRLKSCLYLYGCGGCSTCVLSDTRGPRHLPLKKVYFFVGHLVEQEPKGRVKKIYGNSFVLVTKYGVLQHLLGSFKV